MTRLVLATAATAAIAASSAEASPLSPVPHTISVTVSLPDGFDGQTRATADYTNIMGTLDIPKITGQGAVITSIVVALTGSVFGDFSATNTIDARPEPTKNGNESTANFTRRHDAWVSWTTSKTFTNQVAKLGATISIASPDPAAQPLAIVLPLVQQTFTLAPSQVVRGDNLSATASTTQTYDANNPVFASLAPLFLGQGTLSLDVEALGASQFVGSGNASARFTTLAGATATVTVNYTTTPVPEPASLALLGAGLLGIGLVQRKRKTV
ncbi:choice-of-anchor E domain-containing protein [Paracraurococcus lichenis]|uniref:Choice-of-anchor E domain-containing protein n=1 Tax=Paracraurococcus lichenis TaxID=3064888 RepID=A0ABT9E187_9PROT|nr:choice-of-anchor E domain-containing protein [Paracraurococcus sp. LOR1-02]MDO9709865.1 choice-of-anchor E domain-containing protein [Paracraurococcus sp. LOR1-02]